MLIEKLQATLETIYRIDSTPRVGSYLINQNQAKQLDITHQREVLIIQEDIEYTNLGLFLSNDLILGASRFLTEGFWDALDSFCATLEGISHFVYFTHSGQQTKPVSRIELEVQAEIDKFIFLKAALGISEDLISHLFDSFSLREDLDESSKERYLFANRIARRYAKWVESCFRQGTAAKAFSDARLLYRKTLHSKVAHIDCLSY